MLDIKFIRENKDIVREAVKNKNRDIDVDKLLLVAEERKRQDEKWGGAAHDDQHDTATFVQLIEDYAGWARTMAGMGSHNKARNRLVQVAALAVAAVETIDRASRDGELA